MCSAIGDPAPLGEATTCDAFLGGRIRAYQPRKGPRAAIDALFLAAAIPAGKGRGESVLEAGQGSGVASLALAARVDDAHVTGVEIQPALCGLARRNAALNGLEGRITVVEADVTAAHGALAEAGLTPESFDHVAANPPFMDAANGRASPDAAIATAHASESGALEAWARFLSRMAAPGGSVTLIHRADAAGRLLALLDGRFGALRLFPLFAREGEAASRVIVQGVKGSRAPLTMLPGMALHEAGGAYTRAADAVLRAGEPLALARDSSGRGGRNKRKAAVSRVQ